MERSRVWKAMNMVMSMLRTIRAVRRTWNARAALGHEVIFTSTKEGGFPFFWACMSRAAFAGITWKRQVFKLKKKRSAKLSSHKNDRKRSGDVCFVANKTSCNWMWKWNGKKKRVVCEKRSGGCLLIWWSVMVNVLCGKQLVFFFFWFHSKTIASYHWMKLFTHMHVRWSTASKWSPLGTHEVIGPKKKEREREI